VIFFLSVITKGVSLNEQILQALDAEIARLQQARNILASSLPSSSGRGRRKLTSNAKGTRRELSPQARKAIADAQRKRWAKVKTQKKAATTAKKEASAG
jgi:type II secretory pathway component PulJ